MKWVVISPTGFAAVVEADNLIHLSHDNDPAEYLFTVNPENDSSGGGGEGKNKRVVARCRASGVLIVANSDNLEQRGQQGLAEAPTSNVSPFHPSGVR